MKKNKIATTEDIEEKVRLACNEHDLIDPMVLLTALANGKDLTQDSILYNWIIEWEDENGEEPPEDTDWLLLLNIIKRHSRPEPVDEKTKLGAQKAIAEYMHNKKKAVVVTNKQIGPNKIKPLTRFEVDMFERKFKRDY